MSVNTLQSLSHVLPSSPLSTFKSRTFLFLPLSHPYWTLTMPRNQKSVEQRWKPKPKTEPQVSSIGIDAETGTNKLSRVHIGETSGQTKVQPSNKVITSQSSPAIWKPKSYGTVSGGDTETKVESTLVGKGKVDGSGVGVDVASTRKSSGSAVLSKLFSGNLLENFTVDNSTYEHA